MPFEKSPDSDYEDTSQNGINGKETPEYKSSKSLNEKDMTGDQLPKDWSNTKDICSLNDWLNSNKNFKTEQDKRDYESDQGNPLSPLKTDSRFNVRNQRDETKKEESPSLESLKETILELKKSLNEDGKKERQAKVKEKEDAKERNTRGKNKHRKHEKNTDSSGSDTSEPETSDLKKREQDGDDVNEKKADRKSWRRKRTEDNNEDDSPKLFHRAGFGESYLEEETLKELHDRKRRSKGILSDEKHCLDGSCDKNNSQIDEKDPVKMSKQTDCNDLDDSSKKESNDLQPNDAFQQNSKPINNFEDTSNLLQNSKNVDVIGNYDHGNQMENKLTKDEAKGDSLDIFGSMSNELHPATGRTLTLSTDDGDKVEEARMQQLKVFQPEDNDRAKPFQQLPQEKRSPKDSDNVNILVKSENKNLIKFSNTGGNENSGIKGEQPYMLNTFNMKKKVFVENEDKHGKSVATVFNVKIEKAQVDSPMKSNNKQERMGGEEQIPFASPNLGKDKANELYENKHDLTNDINDINQRNIDEKGINFVEINKGSTESSGKEGTQNWYKNNNQLNMNDQNVVGKDLFGKKEEKLSDNKMRKDSIDRTTSSDISSSNLEDKSVNSEEKNKRKYTQIVIVPEGLDDRKLNDMYTQRRILQYMEYSNDDVEEADASYSDKEEDENQRQAEKSSASLKRKGRAAVRDKGKAKVNVLIKEKLDKRKKYGRDSTRKRRNPVSVIEYYDYDSDNEQREHETGEQERLKTNYDKNPIESDAGLEKGQIKHSCLSPATKKDEQEEEVLKLKKLKNKQPKQEFIVHDSESEPKNATEKTGEKKSFESLSTSEEGSSVKRPQEQSGRLSQSIAEREDKFLGGGSKDPVTYIFTAEKDLDPEMIDDILEDIQSIDRKNEKTSNFEPLYEELKKIYDWNQDELQNKPRIKGDHRMYYGANDKLDPTNKMSESLAGQIEVPETEGRSVAGTKTCSTESSDHPESRSSSNVSQNNYFALKSTDDMFKGGSEQSNSTEVKLREPSSIGTVVEWRGQKVSGVSNEPAREKDAGSWSLTGRGQYIDTDSRSPYENRKYLESRLPRERVQNIDREKQTVISSGDLHESFVEPLDWNDDFDEDTRLRLSRSLKTIDRDNPESSKDKIDHFGADSVTKVEDGEKRTSTLITERALLNVSTEISKIPDSTMKTTSKLEDSQLALLQYPPLDLLELFNKNTNRMKRQAPLPYDTFYDDTNEPPADSEKLDYYGYPKKGGRMNNPVQSLISKSDEGMERYDTMEDENYGKVARRARRVEEKEEERSHEKVQAFWS
ncbi:uncharacterized protein LOC117603490 [Osmia lignaria lignaria]|uniref:uncharacterized protein LOC117603490 n=1 Tax=Osmia lignaria lignaria TaxID=1437193 RepID=UPI00402BEAD9